ncbi:hypothetical protein H0H92_007050 [Tricholoma furcatifolium]|nr:hypothetical protein H0H92_007050 [Tricholoma furcatifolium]
MEPDEDFFMNNDVYYNGVDLPMDTPAFPVAPSLGVATPQPALNHQSTGTFFPGAQYVRAELDEVQKANIGRKFGTADRRPIDPPPVVALRLFRVHNPGTSAQFEQEVCDYDAIAGLGPGLICMVDMFEVPGSCWDDDATRASTSREMFSSGGPTLSAYNHEVEVGLGPVYSDAVVGAAQVGQVQLCPIQDSNSPVARSYADISTGTAANSGSSDSEGVLHYHMGCYPITESSNQTQAIVGEKFVEPVVVDYQGLRMLMFAFPDLAVKRIGSFILRYRVFNLSLCMHPGTSSLVAELYGVSECNTKSEAPGETEMPDK